MTASDPLLSHPAANCDPPEREQFPVKRPIRMGGEEEMWKVVRSASLPSKLKQALCMDGLYMSRPEYVVELLFKMVRDGLQRFQVVTDFDQTLTRFHRNGAYCGSCYGILSRNPKMPQRFRDDSLVLHDKYVAIELDPTMSIAEKTPHMKAWWLRQHELFVDTKLEEKQLKQFVHESSVQFRDRMDEFLDKLDRNNIPLLIYSAGIDNLIHEILNERSILKQTSLQPLVVANSMRFNDNGVLIGFRDELIHTFNKNEIFPHHRDYFAKHESRVNVLLMGDMLGDLQMADGMRAKENVLTIGFLNTKISESFKLYCDNFDIVLIDDQTLNLPIAILEGIDSSR